MGEGLSATNDLSLAFVHCCRHWKMPPPSNVLAHCPVLRHMAAHSQLHSTSEYVGLMWGYLKKNPTRCWTTATQSMGLSSAYAMRIQPPVSAQSNHRPWWWSSPPAAVPARYSWICNFSVFHSPGTKKNVCRMYQVRT